MRFFIELSYLGSAYNGWQRQRNAPSVQQALEDALSVLLRRPVETTGAGRTDTGVHASYYVAHFDSDAADGITMPDPDDFCYHLNAILPKDIACHRIMGVAADAHARFDAVRREYKYYIEQRKNPFTVHTAWQYFVPLDIEAMNEAAALLLKYNDFTTFSKLHSNNATNICSVFVSNWERQGDMLIYTISANRFLRNMVRSTVGTLVDVGRGKITVDRFRDILESRDRSQASGSAPAQGLFLTSIIYPGNIITSDIP